MIRAALNSTNMRVWSEFGPKPRLSPILIRFDIFIDNLLILTDFLSDSFYDQSWIILIIPPHPEPVKPLVQVLVLVSAGLCGPGGVPQAGDSPSSRPVGAK